MVEYNKKKKKNTNVITHENWFLNFYVIPSNDLNIYMQCFELAKVQKRENTIIYRLLNPLCDMKIKKEKETIRKNLKQKQTIRK